MQEGDELMYFLLPWTSGCYSCDRMILKHTWDLSDIYLLRLPGHTEFICNLVCRTVRHNKIHFKMNVFADKHLKFYTAPPLYSLIFLIPVIWEVHAKSNPYMNGVLYRNFIQGLYSNLSGPVEDTPHQYSCQCFLGNKWLGSLWGMVLTVPLSPGPRITSVLPSPEGSSISPCQGRYMKGTENKEVLD